VGQAFPIDDFHDSYGLEHEIPGQSVGSQDDQNSYDLADIHVKASRESFSIHENSLKKGQQLPADKPPTL
jgi:hypothetical protein